MQEIKSGDHFSFPIPRSEFRIPHFPTESGPFRCGICHLAAAIWHLSSAISASRFPVPRSAFRIPRFLESGSATHFLAPGKRGWPLSPPCRPSHKVSILVRGTERRGTLQVEPSDGTRTSDDHDRWGLAWVRRAKGQYIHRINEVWCVE
jgi:hypothetical protein